MEDFQSKKDPNTDLLSLVMSVSEAQLAFVTYPIAQESFRVEILDPDVVLGQYLKPKTCQVEAK